MKRIIAVLLLMICCMGLVACADKTADEKNTETEKVIDIASVKDKIISEFKLDDVTEINDKMLLNIYGIETADIKEYACFLKSKAVFSDEVFIIRATSQEAQERIAEKLESHLKSVLAQASGYDAEQEAVAKKCKVITESDVVALFISADHERMQEIFRG